MTKFAECSVDEYLSKRSLSVHDGKLYRAAKMPKSFSAETRSARFVMTDESVDSYGDEVKADGANLERFEKNPVALFNHMSSALIGTWSELELKSKSLLGTMTLAPAGTSAEVDKVFNFMNLGILRAASIGFLPTKLEMKRDDKGNALWEFIIHEWELFECSVVSIPANPNALAKSMKEGDRECRDMIEHVLDTYARMPSGLIVSREEFEKAHKAGSGEKTSIVIELNEWDDEALSAIKKLAEKNLGKTVATTSEPAPDPIVKELEEAMTGFEKKIEDIPEVETERKGLLSKLFGDIRSMFKNAPETKEPETKEPEKPVLATEAEKQAARAALHQLQAEDLAA